MPPCNPQGKPTLEVPPEGPPLAAATTRCAHGRLMGIPACPKKVHTGELSLGGP